MLTTKKTKPAGRDTASSGAPRKIKAATTGPKAISRNGGAPEQTGGNIVAQTAEAVIRLLQSRTDFPAGGLPEPEAEHGIEDMLAEIDRNLESAAARLNRA